MVETAKKGGGLLEESLRRFHEGTEAMLRALPDKVLHALTLRFPTGTKARADVDAEIARRKAP